MHKLEGSCPLPFHEGDNLFHTEINLSEEDMKTEIA